MRFNEPTLLFYPRPFTHHFDNPPREGRTSRAPACPSTAVRKIPWPVPCPHWSPGLVNGLANARLARALVAMHEEPGQAWSLDRMAACAGMSRTAFANAFREKVEQTPADYLANWRMALAQSRLRGGAPVKQLAMELGYANPSALSRAFAAKTGLSPRDWLAKDIEQR